MSLRAPTAKLGVELLNGVNYSLASLRGYMLLGKEKFKNHRASAWQDQINPGLTKMTELSKDWTVKANKEKIVELKDLFNKLQIAQEEIENISGTTENQPAQKIHCLCSASNKPTDLQSS